MKSYVALEQHACLVCGKRFDTDSILLDTRLRPRFDEKGVVTGWGLCPEHQKMHDEGYVALVVVDEKRSTVVDGRITPASAYRTGDVAHIRRSVWSTIFNSTPPYQPMVFLDEEAFAKLKERMP